MPRYYSWFDKLTTNGICYLTTNGICYLTMNGIYYLLSNLVKLVAIHHIGAAYY